MSFLAGIYRKKTIWAVGLAIVCALISYPLFLLSIIPANSVGVVLHINRI